MHEIFIHFLYQTWHWISDTTSNPIKIFDRELFTKTGDHIVDFTSNSILIWHSIVFPFNIEFSKSLSYASSSFIGREWTVRLEPVLFACFMKCIAVAEWWWFCANVYVYWVLGGFFGYFGCVGLAGSVRWVFRVCVALTFLCFWIMFKCVIVWYFGNGRWDWSVLGRAKSVVSECFVNWNLLLLNECDIIYTHENRTEAWFIEKLDSRINKILLDSLNIRLKFYFIFCFRLNISHSFYWHRRRMKLFYWFRRSLKRINQ